MKLKEEIRIEAPRDEVFAALNGADILRRSIPCCEELEKISDTQFNALVRAKLGPARGKLAQLGGRLIDGAARKLAAEFFKNFQKIVGGEADEPEEAAS